MIKNRFQSSTGRYDGAIHQSWHHFLARLLALIKDVAGAFYLGLFPGGVIMVGCAPKRWPVLRGGFFVFDGGQSHFGLEFGAVFLTFVAHARSFLVRMT